MPICFIYGAVSVGLIGLLARKTPVNFHPLQFRTTPERSKPFGVGFSDTNNVHGPTNVTGVTNINSTGTGTTAIGNGANTLTLLGTAGINAAGTANTSIGNTTGTLTLTGVTVGINGITTVTGNTSINTSGTGTTAIGNGANTLTLMGTAGINAAGTANTSIGNTTGTLTLTGVTVGINGITTVTGNTSINTSGTGTTAIGNGANTLTLLGTAGINAAGTANTSIGNTTGTLTLTGVTVGINGITTVTGNTSINTSGTGTTAIGNGANTLTLLGTAGINAAGTANTSIGNTTGTLTLTGVTVGINGITTITGATSVVGTFSASTSITDLGLTANGVVTNTAGGLLGTLNNASANTVLHAGAGGAVTFSAVDLTADVTNIIPVANGGTGVSSLTSNAVLLGGATVGSVGPGAVNTVLLGTGGAPSFGAVDLSTAAVTGTLPVGNGGTGLTTYSSGDMLYASAANTLSQLGIGSADNVLVVSGGFPTWGTVNLASSAAVTGTLPVANGGTGVSSLTSNAVLLGGATVTDTGVGAANTVLLGTGGAPSFGAVDLSTAAVTGTLPVGNGGTGLTTYSSGDMLYASAANTLSQLGIGSADNVLVVSGGFPTWGTVNLASSAAVSGILPVANGGTGVSSLTSNAVLLGGATVTDTGVGAANTVLLGTGAAPSFGAVDLSTAAVTGTLPVGNGGTGLTTYSSGDMLYASAANTLSQLGIGSADNVLVVSGGFPTWGTVNLASSAAVSGILPVANGGSGVSSLTSNAVLLGGATVVLSDAGAANTVLLGTGGAPSFGAVDLSTAAVTGTLPVGNGGTGLATYTSGDMLYATGATTLTKLGIGSAGNVLVVSGGFPTWGTVNLASSAAVSGTLPVANGGTGVTSLTANTVLLGGASVGQTTVGAASTVLRGTGGVPTFGTISNAYLASGVYGNITGLGTQTQALNMGTNGISGVTTLAMGGALTGATTGAFSTSVTSPLFVYGAGGDLVIQQTGTGNIFLNPSGAAGDLVVIANTHGLQVGGAVRISGAGAGSFAGLTDTALGTDGIVTTTGGVLGSVASVPVANGGTGVASLTANAVLLGGATVGNTGVGAVSTVLRGTGGAPTFGQISNAYLAAGTYGNITGTGTLTAGATGAGFTVALGTSIITGTLAVGNGGTGLATYTAGDMLYATGATTSVKLGLGLTNNVLIVTGGVPTGGQVNLASAAAITGTLAVGNGGTGVTSLTANTVLLGGASVGQTTVGASNTVLRGTGGAPTFGTIDNNYLASGVDAPSPVLVLNHKT